MTTANEIIRRSLFDIGVLTSGENPTPEEASDSLIMLNDMLDAWSIEDQLIFNSTEIAFETPVNTTEYTIGDGGSIFTSMKGTIAGDILTVTQLISGSITQNMTIRGTGIAAGSRIIDDLTGAFGRGNLALGTYRLDRNSTVPVAIDIRGFYERPTVIDKAYVRVSYSLNNTLNYGQYIDYPVDIMTLDQYQGIGIKALPGPWVKAIYYNPGQELGQLYIWPNPGLGELHLFVKTLFTAFPTLTTDLNFFKGYVMAMRWNLAELLMPMFGKQSNTQAQMITMMARKHKANIKRLNQSPVNLLRIDDQLIQGKSRDAGWVLSGGFY